MRSFEFVIMGLLLAIVAWWLAIQVGGAISTAFASASKQLEEVRP